MKTLSRMAYVNIIDKTYDALEGKDVTFDNIKASFVDEKDFNTLRMFLSIYVKGVFMTRKILKSLKMAKNLKL